MARTKGAKNRPKTSSSSSLLKFEKQIKGTAITKDSNQGWISWGEKNNYPNLLLDLYSQSPTHRSCIDFAVSCIVGEGIDYEAMQIDGSQIMPNKYYDWDTLLRSIAIDYAIFGSFAIQIIKNKDNKTFSFFHLPVEKVRCSPYDEEGEIPSYWVSKDWTNIGINPPIEMESFDFQWADQIERGKSYLYVYKTYSPVVNYYSEPRYLSGIKSIQSEIDYVNYDLRFINNNFTPTGVLVLNEVETDQERESLIRNVQEMFIGSNNAASLMITFRSNQEESLPEFVPFTQNTPNVNLYEEANKRTIDRILTAHRIPSASLIGSPDLNNNGFSSEADKMSVALKIYMKMTGNYMRNEIVKTINTSLKLNGVETELILKPFNYDIEDSSANTTTETKQEDIDEANEE